MIQPDELLKSIEFIQSYNWLLNIVAIAPNGLVKNIHVEDVDTLNFFDIETIKVGNDKHNWIIVENINGIKKWQRIKQKGGFYNDINNIYYNKYIKYKIKYFYN